MSTAINDSISAKLDAMFEATDSNHDGFVDWTDYQSRIDQYVSGYRIAKQDRRAQALVAAYQMYFTELLRHANSENGRLTKEQYQIANRLATVDTSRVNAVEACSHAVFDILDVDGDNEISKSEFQQFVELCSMPREAVDVFNQLDVDGDGAISRQEYIRAIREFFYSPDPNAPGSLFFGRVA